MAKVYHNIMESEYSTKVGRFTFFFTRLPYLQKFMEKHQHNRKHLKHMVSTRYDIQFNAPEYFDFHTYARIEKNETEFETEIDV